LTLPVDLIVAVLVRTGSSLVLILYLITETFVLIGKCFQIKKILYYTASLNTGIKINLGPKYYYHKKNFIFLQMLHKFFQSVIYSLKRKNNSYIIYVLLVVEKDQVYA
jgi:hypothetical protein